MTENGLVAGLQKAIIYYYLLSYCQPEKIPDFKHSAAALRKDMAGKAGMNEPDFFSRVRPEVCRRIVAYHQATREPDPQIVQELEAAARGADDNAKDLLGFQEKMAQVAALPGRAKPENRLHRKKGCQYCTAACRHGYFTLVSDPQLQQLQQRFTMESGRPLAEQNPLRPVYSFAIDHLLGMTGAKEGYYEVTHVANLSYCLLMLGMAKSRMALPEAQLQIFQAANQEFIRHQAA